MGAKRTGKAARETTAQRRPRRSRKADPDYLADLEESDSQKWKRRQAAARGKRIQPPKPR